MKVFRDKNDVRVLSDAARREGRTVALVPTMGALHDGHLELVRRAGELADEVVVSIFVNPTQFRPGEDFSRYPRDLDHDIELLTGVAGETGAVVFAPDPDGIYPEGFATSVRVDVSLTGVMCGAPTSRGPGHFDGVTTVVAKLFSIVDPDVALFGEKDAQQLAVVRRMATDLDFRVRVVGVPTWRDSDGLALSSRNSYLDEQSRALAPRLFAELSRVADGVAAGEAFDKLRVDAVHELEQSGFAVEYLDLRDADTLAEGRDPGRRSIVAAAARLGGVRLIDNVVIEPVERTS